MPNNRMVNRQGMPRRGSVDGVVTATVDRPSTNLSNGFFIDRKGRKVLGDDYIPARAWDQMNELIGGYFTFKNSDLPTRGPHVKEYEPSD